MFRLLIFLGSKDVRFTVFVHLKKKAKAQRTENPRGLPAVLLICTSGEKWGTARGGPERRVNCSFIIAHAANG